MGRAKTEGSEPAKRKRTYGEGSVYQNAKGEWFASLRFAKGERPRVVRATTKTDAQTKLKELKRQRDEAAAHGVSFDRSRTTVEEFLNMWMQNQAPHIKRTTLRYYRQRLELVISSSIASVRIEQLNADHIRAMQRELIAARISPTSVNKSHTVLNTALKSLVDERRIVYNPAAVVRKLKVAETEKEPPLTPSEVAAMFWAVEGHRLEAMHHFALCGVRIGELSGLRIDDVDLSNNVLRITQNAQTVDGQRYIDTPKTQNAVRTIPLTPRLAAVLRARLEMLLIERGSSSWEENGLLFPSARGTILSYRNATRHLAATQELAGVRKFGWHHYRHTLVSWLSSAGITDEIIKSIVGHADDDVTDRYRQISLEAKRDALTVVDSLLLAHEPTEEQQHNRGVRATWGSNGNGIKFLKRSY